MRLIVFLILFGTIHLGLSQDIEKCNWDSILSTPYEEFNKLELNIQDTINELDKLLGYHDDKSINWDMIGITSMSVREVMKDKRPHDPSPQVITNDIAALYLFEVIITGNKEFCLQIELRENDKKRIMGIIKKYNSKTKTTVYQISNKKEIRKIYKLYESWLEIAKKEGVANTMEKHGTPLNTSRYSWFKLEIL